MNFNRIQIIVHRSGEANQRLYMLKDLAASTHFDVIHTGTDGL